MTVKEMFELAKAGYKPSEIAEMHNLMKDADPEPTPQPEPEPIPEPTPEPTPQPEPEPEIDYKKLYEESQKKIENIQKLNLNQNMGGSQPNDEDILASTIRSFM